MSHALVNPQMILWASQRSQLSSEMIAKKMGIKPEVLATWELGTANPTFPQAQKFAQVVHIPFGFLFLEKPPQEQLPIPDLRTLGNISEPEFSPNFKELLQDVIRKQSWYREYLIAEEAQPLSFIGKYHLQNTVQAVAQDMVNTLGLNQDLREQAGDWQDYLKLLIEQAEATGIWVLRNSVVANNNHRPLSVNEFRGFAISDTYAPLVFINSADAKTAQIFTLIHELAHLWIGENGISNLSLAPLTESVQHKPNVEIFCNQVAAEVLVPEASFREQWLPQHSLEENAAVLSKYYRVSQLVVVRRAFDLHLIPLQDYQVFYESEMKRIQQLKAKSSGGDYFATMKARNGNRFSVAVVTSALEGRLLLRDAASLLGIGYSKLRTFAQHLHVEAGV